MGQAYQTSNAEWGDSEMKSLAEVGHIPFGFDRLDESIERLHRGLNFLEEKLSPVLSNTDPESMSELAEVERARGASQTSLRLMKLTQSVELAVAKCDALASRAEL